MSFDISRLRRSDQVTGVSAVLFFVFLFFFDWYGVSSNVGSLAGVNVNVSKSGWSVFTSSRWVWLITIIVALASVAISAGLLKFESPVQPGVLVAALGALSSVLILYRIVHHPTASASFGAFHASVGIKIGIWLGLIAALGVTYGGYLGMQDEGTSLADVRDRAGGAIGGLTGAGASGAPGEGAGSGPTGAGASGVPGEGAGGASTQPTAAASSPGAPPIPPPSAQPASEPPGAAPA